jgi:magnesium transporter
VQPVDIAEAIGNLPTNLQALAFRFLGKDEAISVYEYLDSATQQSLLRLLRSGEMREVVEEMSPDDRARLLEELPAKVVRQLLSELSPEERRVTAQLLGYEAETAGRLMTTEYIALKRTKPRQWHWRSFAVAPATQKRFIPCTSPMQNAASRGSSPSGIW